MTDLRPRQTTFKFGGDKWLLALRSPQYMRKLRMQWDDVDRAVGPDRILAGLTVPDSSLVYIDQTLTPSAMCNVICHEVYHVASCKRYKRLGEEIRAVCLGEATELLLRKLKLVNFTEDPPED